jgi:hypothetical protein
MSRELKDSTWSKRVWTGKTSSITHQEESVTTKIVQEFALGKKSYLQYGCHRILLKDLLYIIDRGMPRNVDISRLIKKQLQVHELARRAVQAGIHAQSLRYHLHGRGSRELDPSIAMSIMIGNRSKLASEPKDKIFSLLSVFQRAGIHISKPDYERSLEDILYDATSTLVRGGSGLQFLESSCTPAPWPSWVPDLSQHMYIRQATGSFKNLDGEKPCHQIKGRNIQIRLATRVEKVVRVSAACPPFALVRLEYVLEELKNTTKLMGRAKIKISPRQKEQIRCHLQYFDHVRNFLVESADIWTDRQFKNLPSDHRFPPETWPPNARIISRTLLRHLSYATKHSDWPEYMCRNLPQFLCTIMDGLFIDAYKPISQVDYRRPSQTLKALEEPLGALPGWDVLVFLENCCTLKWSSYDNLREAFMGSRSFVTSSGLCDLLLKWCRKATWSCASLECQHW